MEGEGGGHWESGTDTYTLPCVKQIANGSLLYSTGSSARCSVMTCKGAMWGWCEGGPRRGRGDICISVSHSVMSNSL